MYSLKGRRHNPNPAYTRTCRRCNKQYHTPHRHSKICPHCYHSKEKMLKIMKIKEGKRK